MNARVFVLVLATGLFMAVWNADQRPMKVPVAKHDPTRVIVSATDANTGGLLPEGASGKVESMSVITSETESLTDSVPTFTSVDDVIVFGVPAEEPVEGSDPDKASGQRPVSSHMDLLLETFDGLISGPSSGVHEPAAILPAADEATAASVQSSLDDVPLPKEEIRLIIPVPRDLSAGVWNVLSQSGESFRLTIERTSPGHESADRFCVRSAPDSERWCFVRVAEGPGHGVELIDFFPRVVLDLTLGGLP